ncbi:MAG: HAD-IIB family hydrolase [Clostridia bacterium]|nr:HAD-IIB family hydrolase [Clostridia bacterium]
MGLFDGCLITSDIDDTLVFSGTINKKNIEKIEYFISEGGMFSLATGRSANAISKVTSALKRFSPSIVANGSMIYDYQKSKVLYSVAVPKQDHRILKEVIERGIKVGAEIHSGYDAYVPLRTSESDFHQKYEGFVAKSCDFATVDALEWNKLVFFTEDIAEFDKIRKIAEEINMSSDFVSTRLVFNGVTHNYLEVVPSGVSKATAINKLCEIFNIKKGCSYAIGDYYNDVPILNNADISAATAGAPDDVKAVADYVTVACEDGAVADFIDYLTKIHKNS